MLNNTVNTKAKKVQGYIFSLEDLNLFYIVLINDMGNLFCPILSIKFHEISI